MSSAPASESTSPPYDAAEKGALEVHAGLANATALGEKRADSSVAVTTEVAPPSREAAVTPPAKKKVSKWILSKLWFNTYRFVSIISIGSDSNSASVHILQEAVYLRVHLEHSWALLGCVWSLPIRSEIHWHYGIGKPQLCDPHEERALRPFPLSLCEHLLRQGNHINLSTAILGSVLIDHQWTPLWWRLGCTSVLQVFTVLV
jgi:hypothetical protein